MDIPIKPLTLHENQYLFRLYMSDPGLLRVASGIEANNLLNAEYRDDLTGIIAENYVACELTSKGIPLRYWTGKRNAEIEFHRRVLIYI